MPFFLRLIIFKVFAKKSHHIDLMIMKFYRKDLKKMKIAQKRNKANVHKNWILRKFIIFYQTSLINVYQKS